MILMALYTPTILLMTPFWVDTLDFWFLFFTYVVPIIPFALVFDGVISALRTRAPDEILQLICGKPATFGNSNQRTIYRYPYGEWRLKTGSRMHSWPVGYMNWFVGKKIVENS